MAYADRDAMERAIRQRTEKRCRLCRLVKPLTEFHADSTRPDGHEHRFTACSQIVRGVGRPRGPGKALKAPEDRQHRRTVRMTDAEWEHCLSRGDASEYIRGLIARDRVPEKDRAPKRMPLQPPGGAS